MSEQERMIWTGTYFRHSTTIVEEGAEIGVGTKIWHFSHVMRLASIGSRCTLGQNTHVAQRVKIGDDCKIQNNVSLFEGVELEDGVFVGPSVVFTNVFTPRAYVSRHNAFQKTLVKHGASIGANATILCGITIGEYAMIGAGSVVTKDVEPHRVVVGNPAKWIERYACVCGELLEKWHRILPREDRTCDACKRRYVVGVNYYFNKIVG